jgi:hypothetical protein
MKLKMILIINLVTFMMGLSWLSIIILKKINHRFYN